MKILMPEASTLTKGDVDLSKIEDYGDVIRYDNMSRDELATAISDVDAILINKSVLDADMLSHAAKLKYIGECATGFNNIDLEYCNEHGITVTNVPDYSANAVAQQVFAYILCHYSKVSEYNGFVQEGGWFDSPTFAPFVFDTDELFGKTIGIIGYGKIGKAVAKIANAFGMNVLVYTRSYGRALEAAKNSRGEIERTMLDGFLNRTDNFVSYVSFENLLKHSDIVSVHCPLNAESENLFDAEIFGKMRKGAFFINTSRGPVVDEQALASALSSGRLSGAAVDVLRNEPMSKECPLFGIPNCIITPHVAWAPKTTRQRLFSVVLQNLDSYVKGKPKNVVNNPKA